MYLFFLVLDGMICSAVVMRHVIVEPIDDDDDDEQIEEVRPGQA